MTQVEAEPTAFAAWRALGMLVQLVVTDPGQLAAARELLTDDLAELDAACSRFRSDSELVALGNAARAATGPVTVTVSPLLAEAIAVALRAASLTDGDVDPTVGGVLSALGDRPGAAAGPGPGDPRVALDQARSRHPAADRSGRRRAGPRRDGEGLGGGPVGGRHRRQARLRSARQPGW